MSRTLRVGYIPLIDAALLHVAKAKGFAEARHLDLDLVRETSWANIRDKLSVGIFDAAHMLAPAAIAATLGLGLGHLQVPLVAPVALGLDGNALTFSRPLYDAIVGRLDGAPLTPRATANALALIIAQRRAAAASTLTLAHVFPFSSHHYQLRLWLKAGGIDPDVDLRLVVVPPPFMVQALASGHVDGFCVGAPWNTIACDAEVGRILHHGSAIVRNCPEKILALRADFAEREAETVGGLAAAIKEASGWCAAQGNREELAAILTLAGSSPEDLPRISPALLGQLLDRPADGPSSPPALRLDPAATRLRPSQAEWLFRQMAAAHQLGASDELEARVRSVYRPDLGNDLGNDLANNEGNEPGSAFERDQIIEILSEKD